MKKNKFSEFFKGKGYYVLLFVGVLAIAAVAFVGAQLSSNENSKSQDYVDLNEPDNSIAEGDDGTEVVEGNPISENVANNGSDVSDDTAANDVESEDVVSNEVEYDDYSNVADNTEKTSGTKNTEAAVETAGKTVQPDPAAALETLSFNTENGLLWPVNGNVIMDYSMDHTTYFATLMQYKVNPAIILDAEVGQEVLSAADGIVTEIDAENEETGFTVTVAIGDGYSLTYGQLDEDSVSLKVGDKVKEGDTIGTIAEPTKYYSVEGSNLYFEMTQNDESVNPMLYLR